MSDESTNGRRFSTILGDKVRYAPTREQYQKSEYIQHGSYNMRLFLAFFGITSARWDRLIKKNRQAVRKDTNE